MAKIIDAKNLNQIDALSMINNDMAHNWINYLRKHESQGFSESKFDYEVFEYRLLFKIQEGSVKADVTSRQIKGK